MAESRFQGEEPGDVSKSDRRKLEIFASVQRHDWKPTVQHDVTEFADRLISCIDMDLEERFCNAILGRLYFADLRDRHDTIPKAHQKTFDWLFDNVDDQRQIVKWDSFTHWLSRADGNNLYWTTGKPGSGKSTLMKFMFDNSKTWECLNAWTQGQPLVKAGFFFWNAGTVMQMSRNGLLQSFLHTALSSDPATLVQLFKDRWQQFVGYGGGRQSFTWPELRAAFEAMISAPKTPRKFFFVIDGLDELDGDPKELVDLILDMAKHPYVKTCVASRPWLVFADAFENRPSLCVEDLTRKDICEYVTSHFENNKHYTRLNILEPVGASTLIGGIVDKSAGVFLWVHLVVRSLLDGLSNADRLSDLFERLDELPPQLEDLFARLLNSLDPKYFRHACRLFRLVHEYERPPLLALYFADNEDHHSAMQDEIQDLTDEQVEGCLEAMHRRLISRCKGFLEIEREGEPNSGLSTGWLRYRR